MVEMDLCMSCYYLALSLPTQLACFPLYINIIIFCSKMINRIGEGCGIMVLEVSLVRALLSKTNHLPAIPTAQY